MTKKILALGIAAGALSLAIQTPALALTVLTIGQGAQTFTWTPSTVGTGSGSLTASAANNSFTLNSLSGLAQPLSGQLVLTNVGETGTPVVIEGGITNGNGIVGYFQSGISGNFAEIYTGAAPFTFGGVTYNTGATMLSGSFSNAQLSVAIAQVNGSTVLESSSLAGAVTGLSSPLLNTIIGPEMTNLSLDLSAVAATYSAPVKNANGTYTLGGLTAPVSGSFTANGIAASATPEPATWGLMLIGFGGVGAMMRRRAAKTA